MYGAFTELPPPTKRGEEYRKTSLHLAIKTMLERMFVDMDALNKQFDNIKGLVKELNEPDLQNMTLEAITGKRLEEQQKETKEVAQLSASMEDDVLDALLEVVRDAEGAKGARGGIGIHRSSKRRRTTKRRRTSKRKRTTKRRR